MFYYIFLQLIKMYSDIKFILVFSQYLSIRYTSRIENKVTKISVNIICLISLFIFKLCNF